MPGETDQERVALAFSGDRRALRWLIDELTPVVHARVARVLVSFGASRGRRDIRQDVEDFTQEVFAMLFEKDGRVVRSWNPERGASLQHFVGLVAQRYAISLLRANKRRAWRELAAFEKQASLQEREPSPAPSPETVVASREVLVEVIERLRVQLSPKGFSLFFWLVVEQRSPAELTESTGMSPESLYMWRSRLVRSAKEIAEKISLENSGRPRRANER